MTLQNLAAAGLEPLPWCVTHEAVWLPSDETEGVDLGGGHFPDGWCSGVDRYELHLRPDCVREIPPKHWVDA